MLFHKIEHKLPQRFHALARHGVVNRCPNAADAAVAFQIDQLVLLRAVEKCLFQFLRSASRNVTFISDRQSAWACP